MQLQEGSIQVDINELCTGDRVVVAGKPEVWVVAAINRVDGTAQLAQNDLRRVVKIKALKFARTVNLPTDTPAPQRALYEF